MLFIFSIALMFTVLTFPSFAVAEYDGAAYKALADSDAPIWTFRQEWLHLVADEARALGFSEDSKVIKALQDAWWQEQEDLNIVAKVIQFESDPAWCDWEHSVAIGAVIMNRVRSEWFPNNVKSVVTAPGQYTPMYTYDFSRVSRLSYAAAKAAIDGDHNVPNDAYWHANFPQGTSTWKKFICDTGWFYSVTYVCCGIYGID